MNTLRQINTYRAVKLSVAFAAAITFGTATIAAPVFKTAAIATPDAGLVENVSAVCKPGTFVLSDKANVACKTEQFPRLAKDGQSFVNTGIGTEFNTLIRNLPKTSSN